MPTFSRLLRGKIFRATMLKTTLKRPRRLELRQGLFLLLIDLVVGLVERRRT